MTSACFGLQITVSVNVPSPENELSVHFLTLMTLQTIKICEALYHSGEVCMHTYLYVHAFWCHFQLPGGSE